MRFEIRGGARGFPYPRPGPEQPQSWPRDASPCLANFPIPSLEPYIGTAGRWASPVSPRGSASAYRSRISPGRDGGGVASTHLVGGRRAPTPEEHQPQPATVRSELIRLLINARLGFRSNWRGTICHKTERLLPF